MPRPYQPDLHYEPQGRYRRVLNCMIGQTRKTLLCPEGPQLEGKLALVTGGTSGIGAEIVRGLARRGADVVVAARGDADTMRNCAQWEEETGTTIHFISVDLGNLQSVQAAYSTITGTYPERKLDILCANAGVVPHRRAQSRDGIETAYAINCLGHQLLIRSLLQHDRLSRGARVVVTTGDIYVLAKACTSDYSGSGWPAYCRSKLGNLWQVTWLAERYSNQIFVAVHPGVVATGLEGPTTGLAGAFKRGMFLSPELGAQASLIAATQADVLTGSYFHNVHGWMKLPADDPGRDQTGMQIFCGQLESHLSPYLSGSPATISIRTHPRNYAEGVSP